MTDSVLGAAYAVEWLPEAWFVLLFSIFAIYLVLDGFDFGVGLLYATREDESDRELLHAAFGPIWKANEVWFVLFVTVLFAAYPSVYADLLSRHYLLVFILLFGLILRGIGVKLRKERDDDRWKQSCDYAFIIGSAISPLALGCFLVRWVFPDLPLSVTLLGAVSLLVLCLVLGAAFLVLKTDGALRRVMGFYLRTSVLGYFSLFVLTGGILFALDAVTLHLVVLAAGLTGLCSIAVLGFSHLDYHSIAFSTAAALGAVFVGFFVARLYPMIDPAGGVTIRDAIVSPLTLHVTTIMALIFLPAVSAGFVMLYSIFEGVADPDDGY